VSIRTIFLKTIVNRELKISEALAKMDPNEMKGSNAFGKRQAPTY
jgi:hypothetical protein